MNIPVVQKVLKVNDEIAQANRARLAAAGLPAVNIISGPGSGKTTLLECAIARAGDGLKMGVIEGDPDTSLDAERIGKLRTPVVQINTAGGCHLEAQGIANALHHFDLEKLDLLLIENVGNMVCPVSFDLGESKRVAVCSVPEGDDKPAKYASLFRLSDVVVLNKMDLLPHVVFDLEKFERTVHRLNPGAPILKMSCQNSEGLDAWVDWLREVAGHACAAE
jgi:hydrogenase nickel incorporation protein HypB